MSGSDEEEESNRSEDASDASVSSGVEVYGGGDGDSMSWGSSDATGVEGSTAGERSSDASDFDVDDDSGFRSDDDSASPDKCRGGSPSGDGERGWSHALSVTREGLAPTDFLCSGRCDASALPRWRELLRRLNAPGAPAPHDEHFETWRFSRVDLPREVLQALLPTLTRRKIFRLELSDHEFGCQGARFLSEVLENGSRISRIALSCTQMDDMQDASRFVMALGNNEAIKQLHLTGLDLERDWGLLFMILRKCPNITTLDLGKNRIGNVGAGLISEHLSENPPLENLCLEGIDADEDGVAAMLRTLKTNRTLVYLGMWNVTITPDLARIVEQTLFDISSFNAISDSNHMCHIDTNWSYNSPMSVVAGERGWVNECPAPPVLPRDAPHDISADTIRKHKLSAVLCAVYMREGLGGIMKDVDLGLVPRLLALVQQNLMDIRRGIKDFVTFNLGRLLLSDAPRDFPWRGFERHADHATSDDESAGGSNYDPDEDEHFPEDDVLSFDSTDSDDSDSDSYTEYMAFDLTLAFEILRGYYAKSVSS